MRSKQDLEAAIRSQGRAVLVVNTRSRRGRRLFGKARRLLAAAGLEFAEVFPVADPTRLPEVLQDVLTRAPDLVVVGGGDGTIAEAVSHLAQRDVALGVLPLGTTNNFARSLELPVSLPGAIEVLRAGKVADVDVGHAAGKVFANMVSIGLSVDVAANVPHGLKRVIGRGAYALTSLRLLPRHGAFKATIQVGDRSHAPTLWGPTEEGATTGRRVARAEGAATKYEPILWGPTEEGATTGRRVARAEGAAIKYELVTHQLNIANGSHHSGRRFAVDASADDRLLTIYRLGDETRLRLVGATIGHMLRGHRRRLADDMFINTGDEVKVGTEPPQQIDVDGEIRGETPVTIGLLPNALRVLVRRSFIDR